MQFFVYIYTKQCGLCGLAGYLRLLSVFYYLISMG
nr:MAG TPA: zinc finger protein [Caudoviricetes sp.]